jgi:hypothetical protein
MNHNLCSSAKYHGFFKLVMMGYWLGLCWNGFLGSNISTISISIKMDCNGAFGQGEIATHK